MATAMSNIEFLKLLLPALAYCILCGCIIGFDRGRRGSAAGMKTQVFICVGSALFTICSMSLIRAQGTGDAGRMIAQIVSGVGFLGAGTIMARDRIIGLTTAAIIWVMSALGIMIGIGYGPSALVVASGMVAAIHVLTEIEKRFGINKPYERRSTDHPLAVVPHVESSADEKNHKVG
jgi:putative Mg2+ transporter-C (MgtC) family protein